MLHTILVPLDGSPVAEQGLAPACRLARETGATLSLVRGVFYFAVDSKNREADRVAAREAKGYLGTMRDTLARDGFAVRTEVVPCDAVGAILFAADMQEVDLISICTHGRGGLSHALVGSVAEAVLQQADTPILITRALAEPAQQATAPYGTILVPLDGTPFAEAALAYLARERIGDDAELILLPVVAPVVPPYVPGLMGDAAVEIYNGADRETQQRLVGAEAYLQATGTALRRTGPWRTRAMLGVAGPAILAAATSESADLIVLVTHGRHGLDRILYGSVARELLHHAEVPMLILPGEGTHATASGEHRAVGSTA